MEKMQNLLQRRVKGCIVRNKLRMKVLESLNVKLKDLEKLKTIIPPSKLILPPKST